MPKPKKGGFYAVHTGRNTGVFLTWAECEAQITAFPGAKYKKFGNAAEAERFVTGLPSAGASPDKAATSSSAGAISTFNSVEHKGKKRQASPDVEDERGWDVVYCDGACKGNGKERSIAGVGVWWGHNDPRNIAERCPGDQTNNRAELIAILRILETTPPSKKPLLIKSDSQYSINCFKQWLPKWVQNNFRSASGTAVKNVGIIRYLSAQLDARARSGQKVRLQYVKGHNGEEGNEGADDQANMGTLLPPIPERDWAKLEKDLTKRTEAEWRDKAEESNFAVLEVHENVPKDSMESPTKVRRISRGVPAAGLRQMGLGSAEASRISAQVISAGNPPSSPSLRNVHTLMDAIVQPSYSPQRRRHGAGLFLTASHPENSPEPIKSRADSASLQWEASPTSIVYPTLPKAPGKMDPPGGVPVSKDNVNLNMYLNCIVDDDSLWKDLD